MEWEHNVLGQERYTLFCQSNTERQQFTPTYGPFNNLTCSLAAEHVNSSWHGIILCIGIQFEILALIWPYCGLWEEAVVARKNSHKVNMQTIHREGIQPAGGFEPMTLLSWDDSVNYYITVLPFLPPLTI